MQNSYWSAAGRKIIQNLISVKVWFFLLPFIFSTIYMAIILYNNLDIIYLVLSDRLDVDTLQQINLMFNTLTNTFISWCTFNTALIGTIIVVREVFKTAKIRVLKEVDDREKEEKKETKTKTKNETVREIKNINL